MMLFNNPTLAITMIAFWAVVIIVSLIIEFQTAELVSIWFCVGAIASLICAIVEINIGIQMLVFAVVSLVLAFATRPLVRKFNIKNTIPTNSDKLVGMVGKVTVAIPSDGKGKIKINYQEWSAITKETVLINVGTEVVVKEIIGNKLVVEPIEEISVD